MRIGFLAGRPGRVNERVIDGEWLRGLSEFAEPVPISPMAAFKLLGGTTGDWQARFPSSLDELAERLGALCLERKIDTIYMNLPALLPYWMMARSHAGLDVGFLFLAHCVGSEPWLRQWLFLAPWLTARDTLLTGTETSRAALLRISGAYARARTIPLGLTVDRTLAFKRIAAERTGRRLLAIGRIEDVKNIHLLLEMFAAVREQVPDARLTVAGEFTGSAPDRVQAYREKLDGLVARLGLADAVEFPGPVDGAGKEALFHASDVLVNLSTDPGETFGFNLVEAKAWGLPAVCTNWDGFRELVRHGEDGYLVDCTWEEDGVPAIDRDQAVRLIVGLLRDSGCRQAMARRAFEAADAYDVRQVFPRIVQATAESRAFPAAPIRDAAALARSAPIELPDVYRLEFVRQLPFCRDSLLTLLSENGRTPPADWMPLVRPIIGHFAGRSDYAQL
ncbi:glycosyltransferase [Cohnella zeiphila]|uniref:Glycosyltransferase family 4 protein n=1 Tax=Cohnella zeiphila TaxID=2761120 RepID=A0A7X0SHC2_9BACL|nr:glycosyltransferase [Cohnella zeiphila]MBB6729987.1 glycosyltransferase family 4 protein [Cohnella zeiphila]